VLLQRELGEPRDPERFLDIGDHVQVIADEESPYFQPKYKLKNGVYEPTKDKVDERPVRVAVISGQHKGQLGIVGRHELIPDTK
jgi:hypothetical protein